MIDTALERFVMRDFLSEALAVVQSAQAAHPVLSLVATDNIQKSAILRNWLFDTIYLPEECLIDKIEQISIALISWEMLSYVFEKYDHFPLFDIEKKI